ncbi:MAG: hypothetical protein M3277_04730 [Actinomycetota bacterium]|nr:hypothetical protein [Actinomycetota bacterium]
MGQGLEFERERSALSRYYGLPTILGGRGLRKAWQRALWAFIGVIVALMGGLLAVEFATRIL